MKNEEFLESVSAVDKMIKRYGKYTFMRKFLKMLYNNNVPYHMKNNYRKLHNRLMRRNNTLKNYKKHRKYRKLELSSMYGIMKNKCGGN